MNSLVAEAAGPPSSSSSSSSLPRRGRESDIAGAGDAEIGRNAVGGRAEEEETTTTVVRKGAKLGNKLMEMASEGRGQDQVWELASCWPSSGRS